MQIKWKDIKKQLVDVALKWILLTLDINVDGLCPVLWIPAGVRAAVAHIHRFNEQVGHPIFTMLVNFNAELLKKKLDYSGGNSFCGVCCT